MLSLQKKLILFSLFTPRFFIRNMRHKRRGTFFERRGNSLKQTYVERGGTCKTNRNEQEGRKGSKTGSFERTYFLNDPLLHGQLKSFFEN